MSKYILNFSESNVVLTNIHQDPFDGCVNQSLHLHVHVHVTDLYLYYKYLSVVSMAVRRRVDDVTGSRESMDVLDPDGTGDTVSSNTWSHRERLRKNVFQILNLQK